MVFYRGFDMRRMTFLALALLTQSAFAELRIAGDKVSPLYAIVELSAEGQAEGSALIWDVYPEETASIREYGGKLLVTAAPGKYKVKLRSIKGSVVETARHEITFGGSTPQPPGPTPQPPTPQPDVTPNPAPIQEPGFRVLIVYEKDQLNKLPPAQLNAMYGAALAGYLDSKCVKSNNQPEWRVWDQNLKIEGAAATLPLSKALQRPRAAVPWIVISDGRTGFEGPLPVTEAEILALIKKYGGA